MGGARPAHWDKSLLPRYVACHEPTAQGHPPGWVHVEIINNALDFPILFAAPAPSSMAPDFGCDIQVNAAPAADLFVGVLEAAGVKNRIHIAYDVATCSP